MKATAKWSDNHIHIEARYKDRLLSAEVPLERCPDACRDVDAWIKHNIEQKDRKQFLNTMFQAMQKDWFLRKAKEDEQNTKSTSFLATYINTLLQ